jgi:hypothetical protein
LRASGWEGLPPPPTLDITRPEAGGPHREDLSATPVVVPLGLPNTDLEPQAPQTPSLESVTVLEAGTIPPSPVTQSPSISITTLSDFTVGDTSDDESPIAPASADFGLVNHTLVDPTPTDSAPVDTAPVSPASTNPTPIESVTPHGTFYLDDGNVEVLCESTLFRVHTSILSLQSPVLRQTFSQTSLTTAESPNGCPRILSSDTAADFATLLKVIYLLGYAAFLLSPISLSADYLCQQVS